MNKTFKKALAVLLAVFMVAGFVPFVDLELPTASADTWGGGSSSSGLTQSGNSYYINNANGFEYFAQTVRNGTDYSGKTVYLNTDINMNYRAFSGIGVVDKYFRGTFDGQNHTISNLKINISDDRVGLFRNTENATIRKLKVSSANITGSKRGTAVLVGYEGGTLTISDCHVTGASVTGGAADKNSYTGGFVGESRGKLTISSSSYSGNVTASGGKHLGGLVGYAETDGMGFYNCTVGTASARAKITVTGGNSNHIGGLLGCFGGHGTVTVNNCNVFASEINAAGEHAGGLIGRHYGHSNINNCNVTANLIKCAYAGDAGGIIGWIEDDETVIKNCNVNVNEIYGQSCAGGIFGYYSGDTEGNIISDCSISFTSIKANSGGRAGGAVGATQGHVNITNVSVKGGTISSAGSDAGGLIGYVDDDDCVLTNCVNTANVTASACAGGMIGYGGSGAVSTLSRCINYGNISSSGKVAGGILGGCNWGGKTYGVISESANFGVISAGENGGGIVGDGNWTKASRCFNLGNVRRSTATAGYSYGGLCGDDVLIEYSFNRGNVQYGDYAGGILGYNGSISYCYNTGNTSGASKGNKVLTAYVNPGTACFYLQGISGTSQGTIKSQAELRADNMPGQLSSTYFCKDTWGINDYYPIHQWWRNNYFYFNINFNANGGTASGSTTGTRIYGSTIGAPTVSRTGYIFDGWWTASSGGTRIGGANATVTAGVTTGSNTCSLTLDKNNNRVNGSVTYYARWTPITYTVAYRGHGATGGSTASSSHTYDQAKALTSNGFVRTYNVTYNYNGNGAGNNTVPVSYGFAGWTRADNGATYSNGQSVTNLTATNGATVYMDARWNPASTALPNPSRAGHTFAGWYKEQSCVNKAGDAGAAYTPTSDVTLFAKWTRNTYTVTFKNYDGTVVATVPVLYGDAVTQPNDPSKPYDGQYHYEFKNWGDNFATAGQSITGDITFTAQYNAVSHTFTNTVVTAPGCSTEGTMKHTCACGYSYTSPIAATGNHTLVEIPAKPATCLEAGNNRYFRCTVCSKYFVDAAGKVETTVENQTVSKLSHSYTGAVKDNGDGTHSRLCVNGCAEYGNPTAHNYGDWKPITLATCTTPGVRKHTCLTCNAVETENTPVDTEKGHKVTYVKATPHTCTEDGVIAHYHCDYCGRNFTGINYTGELDSVVDPAAHGTPQKIAAVPATCTSAGNIEYFECTVCGDIFMDRALTQPATIEEVMLAKLDHNYTADWISDANGHWHKCANCAAVTAAEAHEFVEKSDAQNHWKECSVCGYKKDIAANEFNIRFENYDGTLLQTKTVKYGVEPAYTGASPVKPATAEKIYVWNNVWSPAIAPATEDATYTATFTEQDRLYTVTFLNYNGDLIDTAEVKYGESASCDVVPVKPDENGRSYVFSRWSKSTDSVTGNITVVAQYDVVGVRNYTVDFADFDGTLLASVRVPEGGAAVYPSYAALPARDGYEFYGWNVPLNAIYKDTTATALYYKSGEQFVASFVNYDNTFLAAYIVPVNGIAEYKGETPVREDDGTYRYTFIGWAPEISTPITENTTFTAQYSSESLHTHVFDTFVETVKAATCTETGEAKYACECGETTIKTTPINPDNHVATELVGVKEATCTKEGYTGDYKCTACGEITEKGTVTAKKDHDLIRHEAKTATCTEKGWDAYVTCANCDYTTYVEIPAKGHTPGNTVIENKVDATCTVNGSYDEVVYCTVCNTELSRDKKTEAATGHELVHHDAKAPTCTNVGWDAYDTCAKCDYSTYVEIPADPAAHKWGEWIIDGEASCAHGGTKHRVCEYNSEHIQTGEIPAGEHTPGNTVIENKVDATCTVNGSYDEVVYCTVCNTELSRETKTETAKGHTPGNTVIENKVDATCTVDGSYEEVVYCTVCNTELSRETKTEAATSHELVHHDAKAPTCTSVGWDAYDTCAKCDYSTYVEIPADPAAHKWGEWIIDGGASCTHGGTKHRVCEYNSEHIQTGEIPAGEHTPVTIPGKEATCTETGLTEGKKCAVCNEILLHQEVIPAAGHNEVEDAAKPATCTETGLTAGKHCDKCNEILVAQEVIPALGHDFAFVSETPATCTENGEKLYKCTRCDE
ncbi:MAG: InlB B-repeat-containing protein, partial [Oscillospiraceae bacterium]|nr:InlB B-repeat-containing protein [Oscillospiraceae bacterium]